MKKPWCALGLVLTTAACDPLATGSFAPPYVTISGEIDGTTATVMPKNVHISVLWQNDTTPGSNYATQPIDVLLEGLTSFSVPITEKPKAPVLDTLPPDTAIGLGLDPKMSWAVGTLVVFADLDEDGRFTVTAPGEEHSKDLVLGADLDIFYLGSGNPAPSDLVGIFPITTGFSLVREPPQKDPHPGDCGWFTSQGHYTDLCQPNPTSVPLQLEGYTEHMTLVDDSRLQGYTCSAYWGPFDYPDFYRPGSGQICDGGACPFCRGYQCPLDLPPPGVPVKCADDGLGLSYVYKTCVDDPDLCGTRFCHYGHGERQAGDPVPAGWPCPVSSP